MVPLPNCSLTGMRLEGMERNKYTCVSICTTWDPDKSSHNVRISDGVPSKLHRERAVHRTDLAMSDTGFSKGLHILDVEWPTKMRGSHAVIGVALAEAPKHANSYTNLLGSTESSWGWDIKNNKLIHNGQTMGNYPKDKADGVFNAPNKISCIIDMITGTIGFKTNEEYLGDAFSGLKHKTVFLAVSSVWGGAEISVAYNKGCNITPLSLQDLSKLTLRDQVKFVEQVNDLPTSSGLKRLIADKSITDLDSIDENTHL